METETEIETSQRTSLSLPPPLNPLEYIGCYVTLITYYGFRYVGVVSYISLEDWIIGLQYVRCFGTEGRGNNGLPSTEVFEWITFNIKNVKTIVPLISNGDLEKPENPQATTDSEAFSDNYGPIHIASTPFTQVPQFPGVSNFVDPRSLPCGLLNQAPIYNDSNPQSLPCGLLNQAPIVYRQRLSKPELMCTPTNPSQSFFQIFCLILFFCFLILLFRFCFHCFMKDLLLMQ